MQPGAITNHIDVAQVALYIFWVFFIGLIYYLHRENKREGYPLLTERVGVTKQGFPFMPKPKTFLMPDGSKIFAPRVEAPEVFNGVPSGNFPGAPFVPLGDPMLAGMGPGAWARRADHADLAWDDHLPKIVPLRAAPEFYVAWEDPDTTGFDVVGLDGVIAGQVVDTWIDRSEFVVRYYEMELGGGRRALIPLNFLIIDYKNRQITTRFITGAQFATIPATKHPEQITLLEEDKVTAYFAGGMLYAKPGRADPII